ncbi:hypothetical protein [Clostridium septicum]|uniref:Uncharacterized protein n=1 Tax=Clostridium septicum TaxID=1504 RepID=A0A9N7PKW7_CLOSE|nr:hypothetical protein [Clostridium septicum]AYE33242.1 hypothetical protein CP523_01575 [Clostridium septicum]MDU1313026.1 hypothetical protein [Clostridium septicum]QAS61414.1 hypothetical protein EI377_12095 [Clostridium septicum]UEC22154.1 hypothetical protein LK444_07300 [Clostridium septicum]USR99815.1 hypothetical protein NH397_09885 [Clostridium septicum]
MNNSANQDYIYFGLTTKECIDINDKEKTPKNNFNFSANDNCQEFYINLKSLEISKTLKLTLVDI